jgi:hypothetical protein
MHAKKIREKKYSPFLCTTHACKHDFFRRFDGLPLYMGVCMLVLVVLGMPIFLDLDRDLSSDLGRLRSFTEYIYRCMWLIQDHFLLVSIYK